MNEIQIHERLATLEAGQAYGNARIDALFTLMTEHTKEACSGSCDTAKEVVAMKATVGTYKKWTWTTFATVCIGGLVSLLR